MLRQITTYLLVLFTLAGGFQSCSYHYAKKIKAYRRATLGAPNKATNDFVTGRSKTGYSTDLVHKIAIGSSMGFNSFSLVENNVSASVSGTVLMADLHYHLRWNFLPIGYKSSLSADFPFHLGVPLVASATGTSSDGLTATRIKDIGPMDMSFFIPATVNFNYGRNAQAGVRGAGIGFGGGYMIAISPGTDFADAGPFTHGPMGQFNFRFGACTLGSWSMYSMRHQTLQVGGLFGISF